MTSLGDVIKKTKMFDNISVAISKDDLTQVLDYLKGINEITDEIWLTLTKAIS